MADGEDELQHQSKIINSLNLLKSELLQLQLSITQSENHLSEEVLSKSLVDFASRIDSLLIDSAYLFELSNCKQLMLSDSILRVKQLEEENEEWKLRKR